MSTPLNETVRLFAPPYYEIQKEGIALLIDPEHPHWMATNDQGAAILSLIDGKKKMGDIVADYKKQYQTDWAKAWLDCQTFLQDAKRSGFISDVPFTRAPYPGRSHVISPNHLSELWLHVTNACNLSCTHCLVSSSPTGIAGEPIAFWKKTIDQAIALGTHRFYITGGEPFLRADIFEMIDAILPKAELVILTNAIPLKGEKLKRLSLLDHNRLKLQISLDGPTADLNDPIRGAGSFEATLRGIKEAIGAGFSPTLTTVVTKRNCNALPEMVSLASKIGMKNIHFLLGHARGRAEESDDLASPPNEILLGLFLRVNAKAKEAGITFDNIEALKGRLLGQSGVKSDLMNIAYESLCVYADGTVYPSAAMAGIPQLKMGTLYEKSLSEIWKNAKIAQEIRLASVQNKTKCKDCYLKYLCGGGDLEHSYIHSGSFLGEDPFSSFHEKLILELLFMNAKEKTGSKNKSGFNRPIVIAAMGEDAFEDKKTVGYQMTGGFSVALSKSSCVLSVEMERTRKIVRDFYSDAAETAQPSLCCTGGYVREDTAHIPKGALDISYGCGSPVPFARIVPGETVVDLGSGGGIDCFVMAKMVGREGRVYGIDMTDAMLKKANAFKSEVALNLGYDVVDFRKGYLEAVPLADASANVILSNCVINLSPSKPTVMKEIWRILKDFGRVIISDIVSEKPLSSSMKSNPRLWGECVSGALTEEQYLAELERAGFYGLSIVKKDFWREIEGNRVYSVVITGFKFEKKAGCDYIGQQAVYLGPMQAVIDEEGHLFPRNQPVTVCTDTAAKLKKPPYQSSFIVMGSEGGSQQNISPEWMSRLNLQEAGVEAPICGPASAGCC
ncbi:MAG: PqqD family peptide modification chaperone [Nitrospirota bacterium]